MAATTVHQIKENAPTQLASQDVGLIFVREYYTFLNKKPYRIHAFYNKDSLFVRGDEGTVSTMVKGQEEIRKKIEECKFEDCKVLITQVDSQVSANDGVLIQVLGQMCNHNGLAQKFSQTFFLATQPNGYYVLNDIFRFLKDDVEIDYAACDQQQQQQTEPIVSGTPVVNHATAPIVEAPVPVPSPAPVPAVVPVVPVAVASPIVAQAQVQAPPAPVKSEVKKEEKKKVSEEEIVKKEEEVVVSEVKKTEPVQKEPETEEKKKTKSDKQQSKAEPKQQQQKQQQQKQQQQTEKPTTPVKPSAPMTWASRAAPNGTPVSVEKSPVISHASVNATPVAPTPAAAAAPVTNATTAAPSLEKQVSHNQQRQQQQQHQNKNQNPRTDVTNIFVKLVNDQITEEQLLEAFNKIGSVKSSNISRSRNCAFVEFNSPESCQKALAQHKVQVGGHTVLAEERRYNNQSNPNQTNQRYNNNNQNRSSQSFDQRRSNSNNNQNRRNNQNQQSQGGNNNRQNNQTGKGRGAPAVK